MRTPVFSCLLLATTFLLVNGKKLTKESLKELAGSEFNLFVNFHSPRCPQCVALQPIWSRLTTLVLEHESASRSTIIASVDCTKENELCNKEKVRGYPTLKIFRAKDPIGTEYEGPRDLNSLIELLQKQLGLAIQKPAETDSESSSPPKTTFVVKGMTWDEIDAHLKDDAGDDHLSGDEEEAADDAVRDDGRRPMDGPATTGIPEPISGLHELNEENYQKFLSKGRHFVKFFTPWCSHCQKLEPTWVQLADSFKYEKSASISRVNCETQTAVCEEFEVKGYPTILWIVDGKVMGRYDGSRTHSDLKNYVLQKVAEDKDSDTRSDEHVLLLTDTTFEKVVREGVTFVAFMVPWCTQCNSLNLVIDELTVKFVPEKDITIAKVDCSQYDSLCSSHGVDAYPTLMLYQWGDHVQEYEGEKTLQAMHIFIQKHLTSKDRDEL